MPFCALRKRMAAPVCNAVQYRTLTAVIQSDVTPVLQPLSPNPTQFPRSTCQSNSPSVPHDRHQHRHFERVDEMHGRLSGCSTRSHKHIASSAVNSAASQAFGSQQGKTHKVCNIIADLYSLLRSTAESDSLLFVHRSAILHPRAASVTRHSQ